MQDSLLIELLTEELPPKSLQQLAELFAANLTQDLKDDNFITDASLVTVFATPRRLAVHITEVARRAPDSQLTFAGPAVSSGFDKQGQPTPALLGFAKKNGVTVAELTRIQGVKGEQFAYQVMCSGGYLATNLELKVEEALRKLPVKKLMRWGSEVREFVRPVHSLLILHGSEPICGAVLGLAIRNEAESKRTRGHRFLSQGEIEITSADNYEAQMENQGKVIASFARRRDVIQTQLQQVAQDAKFIDDEDLLNEVTGLVEYPVVLMGTFNEEFLSIPQECLILSMKQHQKYFPLIDDNGKLLARFLMVSNIETDRPEQIIRGNERVLRARLSDAKFFYDQDRKIRLEERTPKLADVVYHNKLGSQLARVHRIKAAAGEIAYKLHAERNLAERAALLCKADLLTGMVGEFPELQGIMGQYYAKHDGEIRSVRYAIGEHYRPRFAGDALPRNLITIAVALADKLDTLVGIYGIGLIPTGDKDPFGLRRNALGVLRILSEMALTLDLVELLQLARDQFAPGVISESAVPELHTFMLERLKNYLRDQDFAPDEIESVVSQNPTRIDLVVPRLRAVQAFRALPEADALAAANKRIRNILKQAKNDIADEIDATFLIEAAEQQLAEQVILSEQAVIPMLQAEAYTEALQHLAALREPVDRFFDTVMVMSEDEKLRNNRLALLNKMQRLFSGVADLSKLQN